MAFCQKFFGWKKMNKEQKDDWEQISFASDGIDFRIEEQRSRYIMGCLEQIAEADRESGKLTEEYELVTSYLSDMEEIETLPASEKKFLDQNARAIVTLEQEIEKFRENPDRMTDSEYHAMRGQEETVAEGIAKLKEAEQYAGLVKQDLKKLDVERQAHDMRGQELETMCANYRGMAVIFMSAMVICLVMLAVLQFLFQMDTRAGYFITVLAGAVAVTATCVKFLDAQKELDTIRRAVSKLIQLQNKVKIRYVNNKNLRDYLCLKYNTDSSEKLAQKWQIYQKEKEERRQFAEAEAKIEVHQEQLVSRLRRYRLKDPERWIHQAAAILDKREMVELRHELILRRQALRKQLDYNKNVASAAHQEVLEISNRYPMYRSEILDMVDKYQRESDRIS